MRTDQRALLQQKLLVAQAALNSLRDTLEDLESSCEEGEQEEVSEKMGSMAQEVRCWIDALETFEED